MYCQMRIQMQYRNSPLKWNGNFSERRTRQIKEVWKKHKENRRRWDDSALVAPAATPETQKD